MDKFQKYIETHKWAEFVVMWLSVFFVIAAVLVFALLLVWGAFELMMFFGWKAVVPMIIIFIAGIAATILAVEEVL